MFKYAQECIGCLKIGYLKENAHRYYMHKKKTFYIVFSINVRTKFSLKFTVLKLQQFLYLSLTILKTNSWINYRNTKFLNFAKGFFI